MTEENETVNKSKIAKLIVNNESFSEIEAHLNRFNPIKIMKMEGMEIRHSAILSWLLNPRENHGLHDEFLRRFLSAVLKSTEKDSEIGALDLYNANLNDANVYTEWNHIDIFIECPVNKWAFVIENKVYASQSKDQLKGYASFFDNRFKNHKKSGILLTLYEEEPDDEEAAFKFHSIKYNEVVVLLDQIIRQTSQTLSTRVLNFIKYYRETISELCDMNEISNDMKALARKVYQENKVVIDFIVENSSSTEFQVAVSQLVAPDGEDKEPSTYEELTVGNNTYVYFAKNQSQFSFLPKAWISVIGEVKRDGKKITSKNYQWIGCEKWWWSYPLIFWIQLEKKSNNPDKQMFQLKIYAEVGPYKNRKELIEAIEDICEQCFPE